MGDDCLMPRPYRGDCRQRNDCTDHRKKDLAPQSLDPSVWPFDYIGAHFGRHSELGGRRYLAATESLLVLPDLELCDGRQAELKDWIIGCDRERSPLGGAQLASSRATYF